jgi:YidC/Oxa1 family membrane protein insertase
MISTIFHAAFYDPIYNILVALVALVPGGDIGVAVVLLTIVVRLVLLPFSLSAAKHQRVMKLHEPKLAEIRELHKDDKQLQATKTFEFYREQGINPFSPILTVLIQIPVLLALFWVFYYESFTVLNMTLLYPFTPIPGNVTGLLFGLIPLASKSIILAILVGITQYAQAHLALSGTAKPQGTSMQAEFARSMNLSMLYIFPFLIGTIAYTTSSAIALYFITTNVAGILQEWYVRTKFRDKVQGAR